MTSRWKNPGRQDMSFTPFVLSILPVYSHWWIPIGVPSMNSSAVLRSLLLDFPTKMYGFPFRCAKLRERYCIQWSLLWVIYISLCGWTLDVWCCLGAMQEPGRLSNLHPGLFWTKLFWRYSLCQMYSKNDLLNLVDISMSYCSTGWQMLTVMCNATTHICWLLSLYTARTLVVVNRFTQNKKCYLLHFAERLCM